MDALKRTEVTDSNLSRIDFGSVAALTFAAGGAMGEAGRIEFSTADGSWYHLNCLHGPVSIQQFHRAFPSSPTNAPELPAHWRELPLGAGNCLYIHERAYQKYLEGHDAADPEDVLLWWRSVLGKPLLTKEERYAWLVEEAKSSYPQTPAQKDGLIWCGRCRDEINLWTYWQGRGCLSPEILVVGQDWGNPETAVGRQCLRNIENRRPCLENNSFPSDKNLAILFEQAFNMDIGKPDRRLFFTNLVLGCRSRGRWKAPSPTGEKGQPLLTKIAKALRSLYRAYIDLKGKFERLQGDYDRVREGNARLSDHLQEVKTENKALRGIAANYERVKRTFGPEEVERAVEDVKRQEAAEKERRKAKRKFSLGAR